MEETRVPHRVEPSLKARIVVGSGQPVVDCMIKDLSGPGAKIEVDGALALPPDFDLQMARTGESFHAEIRWRYAHLVGVRFVGPETLAPGEATRDKLIVENKKLREALEAMATRLTQLGERVVLPAALLSRHGREAADGRDAVA